MSSSGSTVELSREDIAAEDQWLRSLGLTPPAGHLLLERPFAEPLGRRSYLVPARWHWDESPATVIPRHFVADLDILETAMRKSYVGWETAQSRGWNWPAFFEDWRRQLSRAGDRVTTTEAFEPWKKLLDYQLDNHSGPVGFDRFRRLSWTACLTTRPAGPIVEPIAHEPRRAWLAGPAGLQPCWALSGPWRGNPFQSVRDSGGNLLQAHPAASDPAARRESIRALSGNNAENLCYRRLAGDIAYVRVPPDLSYSIAPDLPETHRNGSIIFDLRWNRGGAAQMVLPFIERLVGQLDVPYGLRRKESCLSRAFAWGHAQLRLKDIAGPLSGGALQIARDALARVTNPASGDCGVRWHERAAQWCWRDRHPPSEAGPRIIVLVDQDCGSDGELLVFQLGSLPHSVIVGPNTAGVAGFAQPGYFVLPRTRIRFRLAMALTDLYGDGRAVDGYGLESDVLLPSDLFLDVKATTELARQIETGYTREPCSQL